MQSFVLLPLLAAFLITLLLTPLCIFVIKKIGLVDDPKIHKHPGIIHKTPIPRGGGIPLFLGVFITSLFFLPISQTTIAIFAASFIALAIGVLDDKLNTIARDVSPYLRFAVNILCGFIIVSNGITIRFITNPLGGILQLDAIRLPLFVFDYAILFSDVITVLWIVWVMNMLNWSKGVDGQMPGIVAISATVIGILSLRFLPLDPTALIDARLAFIIAGTALGFLIFNFYPAKIFPGYGATALYLLLAVVSILSSAKLATAILVMAVPIVDGVFTILRRIFSGRSPFKNDRRHLHHLLLDIGFTQRQIALFYWAISGIVGLISLSLSSKEKLFAIIMILIVMGGGILFLHLALRTRNEKEGI